MDPSEKSDQSFPPPYFEHNFQYYENKAQIELRVLSLRNNLIFSQYSNRGFFLTKFNKNMYKCSTSIAFQVGLAQYSFFKFLPPSKVLLAAQ